MDKQALTELLFEMLAEEQPAARPASAEPVRLVILLATPRRPVRVRGVPARDKDAVTAQRVDANVWDLTTADGSPDIPLPPEVAQRCYGQAEQTVRLTLHRVVAGDGFEPQLEVTPAPERDMLTFVLAFADGEQRTLSVPKPRGRRTNAWSQGCAPLPAAAFGPDAWPVHVEMRQHSGMAQRPELPFSRPAPAEPGWRPPSLWLWTDVALGVSILSERFARGQEHDTARFPAAVVRAGPS